MNTVIIKSKDLAVTIALKGAEVRRVSNVLGHDYMWDGNPEIWSGVSPTLFPVVGKTNGGVVRYLGKSYPQGNHGFARNSEFAVIMQTDSSVSLRIITSQLGDVYPFNLQFTVTYTIINKTLITKYEVTNLDECTAYFSVGAHPAFKCPFDEDHNIDDYVIEFSEEENGLRYHEITPEAFFTGKVTTFSQKQLQLTQDTFANDAIVYDNYSSQYITLKEKNSSRYVRVSLSGFPWLGLWSKVGADYVCIEPWCGHSDGLGFDGDIDKKAAIEQIDAKETWSRDYSIEFGY